MRKIFSFNRNLYVITGVHKVLMDVHNAIKGTFEAKILGTLEYKDLHPDLHIEEEEYQKKESIFDLRNSILIVHERRDAVIYNLLSLIPFFNFKVVYIHHGILTGNKRTTFLSKNIITISERCIENLTEDFGVKREYITKIHNAVVDKITEEHKKTSTGTIKILYPAKIYPLKRQLELVKNISSRLDENVQIIFAGDGEDCEELKRITEQDKRFECLGFVNNIKDQLANVDYCMLFSEKEGLPISLIEATMMGVPIICNDVGGNLEIAKDGYNAFVCNDWEELIGILNSLTTVSDDEYKRMSQNSRAHYERCFNFETFKTKYIEYIKKIQ